MFLTSKKDILIVEGPTDDKYLKAAIKAFHENNRFLDLDFDCLPCGGAANVEVLIDKFKPNKGQLTIAIWDNDNAGHKAMEHVLFGDNKKRQKLPYAKKYGKIWYTFYPAWNKNIENFNVEDYFTKKILRSYIKFRGFSNLPDKGSIKNELSQNCQKGKYKYEDFVHFEKLFVLIERIREADIAGKKELLP